MNTFSVNTLKSLDENTDEFINKYILKLDFLNAKNQSTRRGERLHGMISYYIRGFDIEKIKNAMASDEKEILEKTLSLEIFKNRANFIKSEEPFLVKCSSCNTNGTTTQKIQQHTGANFNFYLTGRFDAIYFDKGEYIIYDWKSKNIPKDPENDLQSVVYLYCGSKIFSAKNISICYLSLEKGQSTKVHFSDEKLYFERILNIIKKLPSKYLT